MGSKIIKICSILVLVVSFTLIGCTQNEKANISTVDITKQDKPYTVINPNDVEWMTMVGGLHITTKVLFKENSKDKIRKIISLINKGSNPKSATEDEKSYIYSGARPIGIKIKLQDGTLNYIYPSPKRVKEWGVTSRDDKFVMVTNKDGVEKYYSFTSSAVPKYLREFQVDMPRVEQFIISPYKVNLGDKIKIYGDGCTE